MLIDILRIVGMDSDDGEHPVIPPRDLDGLSAIHHIRSHGEYEFDSPVNGPLDHLVSVSIELWHPEMGM